MASPFFMEFQITPHQLKKIICEAAELGAIMALTRAGKLRPYLKKAEAFRSYGRANVEKWLAEGQLTIRKDGNESAAWRIGRLEVEAIVKSMAIWQQL
jgi:hypothetical protein